jgi:hypothetical protein
VRKAGWRFLLVSEMMLSLPGTNIERREITSTIPIVGTTRLMEAALSRSGPANPAERAQFGVFFVRLLVAQHYPPPHLPAALQVTERRARLVCRPRLNRDRRNLTSLDESKKLLQILKRTDIGALDWYTRSMYSSAIA